MTKKVLNVIICICVAFFVVFFAGSFAYEEYIMKRSDREYERSLSDLEEKERENQSGQTSEETK